MSEEEINEKRVIVITPKEEDACNELGNKKLGESKEVSKK